MGRLVGERRAIAAAVLAFYGLLYTLVALQAPEGWMPAMSAMAGVYGLGFLAVVAGYFWGRWYAMGVGLSGLISAGVSMFQIGPEPVLLFFAGTHAAIALPLWGASVAKLFDARPEWRTRFAMDEHAAHRLGNAVTRLGISLPFVLLFALAPKADGAAMVAGVFALLAGWALIRGRALAVPALGAASVLSGVALTNGSGAVHTGVSTLSGAPTVLLAVIATVALAAAMAPFAASAVRFLRGDAGARR